MKAAQIEVINPNLLTYAFTVSNYPFLKYSILMPWIAFPTWTDLRGANERPSYSSCRKRALNLANLLNLLWIDGTAHCDICPNNIIIGKNDEVYLIDFENIFHNSLSNPPWGDPSGQDGYRHRYVQNVRSQWCRNGDLFGGALLISELLTWHDPQVREHSLKEKYIDQANLHDTTNVAFKILIKSLQTISQECSNLFYLAWMSKNLDECPTMEMWLGAILRTPENLITLPSPLTHSVTRVKRDRPERYSSSTPSYKTSEQKQPNDKSAHIPTDHVSRRRPTKRVEVRVSEHVKERRPAGQYTNPPMPQVKPSQAPPMVSTPPQRSTPMRQPSQSVSSVIGTILAILFILVVIAICIGISISVFN